MLYKRVLSALIALPIFLSVIIFAGNLANFFMFLIAITIALSEYFNMSAKDDQTTRRVGVWAGSLLFGIWGLTIVNGGSPLYYHLSFLLCFMGLFLFFLFRTGDMQTVAIRTSTTIFGVLYVDLLAIYLVAIHNIPDGWKYLIVFFAIIWANDTGAYFAGKSLGKHKFYEKISPKKTWEGSIGGALLGIFSAYLLNWIVSAQIPMIHVLILALCAGYIGQVGDLCESLIKRSYKIKDSGSIIPGHGGILDRVDAVLFAAPFFYYYITLVVR